MSKFFKALEQARRDHRLHADTTRPAAVRDTAAETAQLARPYLRPVPETLADLDDGIDERLVSLVAPAALEAEQYRALRNVVEQLHRTAGLRVIAVSSPGAGDGKTVTAINLAGALAQASDARVLLVDADLRRPSIERLLAMSAPQGMTLVDAIVDPEVALEQVAQPRPPFNLHVVCAGQTPPSPYEVLKAPRFAEIIERARQQYDLVIIDTPPLVPVQDCRVIGRWVDGFLLVVAANRTPRHMFEESLAILDVAKVLGVVFNEDDAAAASGYSHYYGVKSPTSSPIGASTGLVRRLGRRIAGAVRDRASSARTGTRASSGRWQ
jgi:capsular exopolysaccharide synthesis family protein